MKYINKFGVTVECSALLKEEGLLLENGKLMTTGVVLEHARELGILWHKKDWSGFMEALPWGIDDNGVPYNKLNDEDDMLLCDTVINDRGDTVRDALFMIDDLLYEEDKEPMDEEI